MIKEDVRLLKEADYVGNIDSYGHVNGVKTYNPLNQIHSLYGMGIGSRWRYLSNVQSVVWTNKPTKEEIIVLDNWFSARHIFPKRNIGPDNKEIIFEGNIKKLILEGSRINYLNREIEKLKSIRANVIKSTKIIDKDRIIHYMSKKIEKLEKELSNWEGLYKSSIR